MRAAATVARGAEKALNVLRRRALDRNRQRRFGSHGHSHVAASEHFRLYAENVVRVGAHLQGHSVRPALATPDLGATN